MFTDCRRAVIVSVLVLSGSALALGQTTTRVSLAARGQQADGKSKKPSLSTTGRYVAFQSDAPNLVPSDTNGFIDVFVFDRQQSLISRVSVDSNGVQGNGPSWGAQISGDGRYVVFQSVANNLVPGDSNQVTDVLVHDRETGETQRVSIDDQGHQANGVSEDAQISADGRYVVFDSAADNLVPEDHNRCIDTFGHDLETRRTARLSVTEQGVEGNQASTAPVISGDGRYVAFPSSADNLVANDANRQSDVFLTDRQNGHLELVSISSSGKQGNASSAPRAVSQDGRHVVFVSHASNFVPDGDANGSTPDVFLRDRQAGLTTLMSVDSNGVQGNAESGEVGGQMSADARYIAFNSNATNLVPDDVNGVTDVFVHDRQTGETERVSVDSYNRPGDGSSGPLGTSISADGRYIAFDSVATQLVAGDSNGTMDVFVHDLITLSLNGIPSYPNQVNYTLSRATQESGNVALVLLSCSGIDGFSLGGRVVPLTWDACTLLGLSARDVLSALIDNAGIATTPPVEFPAVPPGMTIYSAALTIDWFAGEIVAIGAPVSFITQ